MEQRIEDIEVKISYLEKQILDLDGVVRELGDAVMLMREELRGVHEALRMATGDGDGAERATKLRDDLPPHY